VKEVRILLLVLSELFVGRLPTLHNSHNFRYFFFLPINNPDILVSLSQLPQCLCIELQRTYYANDGSTRKISAFVEFPEFLDVSPYRYQKMHARKGDELTRFSRPLLRGGSNTKNSSSMIRSRYIYIYNLITSLTYCHRQTLLFKKEHLLDYHS